MAAFSKSVTHTCYEVGHTWTPYCSTAIKDVAIRGFAISFKIYASLYLVTAILRRRKKEYYMKRLIPEVLQSTIFLGSNAFLFIAAFCFWRRVVGAYYFCNALACGIPTTGLALQIERADRKTLGKLYVFSGYLPSLCASYAAILIERKRRRGVLALYMSNLAVETLYRMAVSRGYITQIANGETWLFSIVSAVFMWLHRSNISALDKSTEKAISFVVGSDELPPSKRETDSQRESSESVSKSSSTTSSQLKQYCQRVIKQWRALGFKNTLCKHNHGCHAYCIEGFLRMFGVGYVVQAGVKSLSAVTHIFKKPGKVLQALKHKDNFGLALFLGTYTGLFRLFNCILRKLRNKDDPSVHGLISGFIAGWAMLFYKSSTVALYLATKLVEILYFKGVDLGKLPHIPWGDTILYAISTSVLFHAAVFEPHNIRPAYWKWLLNITDNKFAEMNRQLLDVFGTQASKIRPDFWPDYDPRFTNLVKPG